MQFNGPQLLEPQAIGPFYACPLLTSVHVDGVCFPLLGSIGLPEQEIATPFPITSYIPLQVIKELGKLPSLVIEACLERSQEQQGLQL